MIVIGVDSHKRTHTAVAADETGRRLAETTVAATSAGHLVLVRWAARFADHRFALEDRARGFTAGRGRKARHGVRLSPRRPQGEVTVEFWRPGDDELRTGGSGFAERSVAPAPRRSLRSVRGMGRAPGVQGP